MTSFASLSSSLLARKGQAKPAMRPQNHALTSGQDDLGWNDMGYVQPPSTPVQSYLTPLPGGSVPANADPVAPPVVRRQQEEIAQEFGGVLPEEPPVVAAEPVIEPVADPAPAPIALAVVAEPVAAQPAPVARPDAVAPRAQAGSKAKAAFTLRLDAERHLRLRLACAVRHQSAQRLVVEALDAFLATVPALDDLAAKVPPAAR